MYMNVSINILYVVNPQHNVPQLLGRKFFRQFFSPATYRPVYCLFDNLSDFANLFHGVIIINVNVII